MEINIQRAILASFLWANDLMINTDEAFILNSNFFTGDRKTIASKINEETRKDRFYGMLNLVIENSNTAEWMEISAQTPLPISVAKRYHDSMIDPRGDLI